MSNRRETKKYYYDFSLALRFIDSINDDNTREQFIKRVNTYCGITSNGLFSKEKAVSILLSISQKLSKLINVYLSDYAFFEKIHEHAQKGSGDILLKHRPDILFNELQQRAIIANKIIEDYLRTHHLDYLFTYVIVSCKHVANVPHKRYGILT